jgi:putative hemolysin
MADRDVSGARRAIALATEPGRFLSTVQFGITLIGIVAGAFSGATLGGRLAEVLVGAGLSRGVADPLGFGLVISAITYFSLIVGELVPKQIALRDPERIACLVAPGMTALSKIAAPIVWLLQKSGGFILRLLGQSKARDDTVTDAEIHSMIEDAESAGVIEPEERDMIAGVMRLGDKPARSVMIPRPDVQMVDVKDDLSALTRLISQTGHSSVVVYEGSPDNVIGVVQAKDLAAAAMRKRAPTIKQLVKQAPVIADTLDALEVVRRLKASEVHFGLVYDQHGHFEGIVTNADILEAIVGAFREEKRETEPEIVERADGSMLISGWASADKVLAQLGIIIDGKRDYSTIAGYALERLGRLAVTGDKFSDRGYDFEIVDIDNRRIDKLLVQKSTRVTRRVA